MIIIIKVVDPQDLQRSPICNKISITSHAYQSSRRDIRRLKAQLIYAVICTTTSRQIYVLKYVLLHMVIIIAPQNETQQILCSSSVINGIY